MQRCSKHECLTVSKSICVCVCMCMCVYKYIYIYIKGNVYHKTGHEGPEEEQRYYLILSLTSALNGVCCQRHGPAALPPGKGPGTNCIVGWVGLRAGLGGCRKSRLLGIRSPELPASRQSLYRLRYPGLQFIYIYLNDLSRTTRMKNFLDGLSGQQRMQFLWTSGR